MRRTAEDADKTRARILASAIDVFTADGASGASLEKIATHAGVTSGALYHHFADKRALFAAAVEALREELEEAVDTHAKRAASTRDALLAAVSTFLLYATRPSFSRLIMLEGRKVLGDVNAPAPRDVGAETLRTYFVVHLAHCGIAASREGLLVTGLVGAVRELARDIVRSGDTDESRARALRAFTQILDGLTAGERAGAAR